MTESTHPDEYGTYSSDDDNQLTGQDTLGDGSGSDVVDELDRGYSPPERWSPAQGYGNTAREEATGENFLQRLAQEEPETVDDDAEGDEQLEPGDEREVGDVRSGRLVAPAEGFEGLDYEQDVVGRDVGIDGGAASAEEAAMHIVPDDET